MPQPTEYDRQTSFTLRAAENPDTPYTGVELDQEFNAVKTTLDELLVRVALIQRDDGDLANNSVGFDQLDPALNLEFNPPGAWVTATAYGVFDTVFESNSFYKCIVAHTSGVFATDLAASKWELIAAFDTIAISDGAITTAKLDDGAVTEPKLSSGAVTVNKLGAGSVTHPKLGDLAVETDKLDDEAVTDAKLAADAVTTVKILDLNVTTAKINDLAVTTGKIAADAVTTVKILDAQVTLAKLAQEVIDAINSGGVIEDDQITYAKIQNVTATNRVLGRSTAGAGDIEEIVFTAVARTFAAASNVGAQRAALELASVASAGTFASLTGKPVTLAGYGITDAEPLGEVVGINNRTANYVLVLADKGKIIECNKTTGFNLTIPPFTSVAFPTGSRIDIVQLNTGQVTIVPGSGVTVSSADGNLKLRTRYSGATLYKRGSDVWVLIGDLTA